MLMTKHHEILIRTLFLLLGSFFSSPATAGWCWQRRHKAGERGDFALFAIGAHAYRAIAPLDGAKSSSYLMLGAIGHMAE